MLSALTYLQKAATVNGNGTVLEVQGYNPQTLVEIVETAGGTCTVTLQGSLDQSNWYAAGYQRIDAQATPARAVAGISVTANLAAVFQLLDVYPHVRAVVSAIAGGASVSVRAYLAA